MRACDARCRALRGVFFRGCDAFEIGAFEAFDLLVSFGTFAVVTKL